MLFMTWGCYAYIIYFLRIGMKINHKYIITCCVLILLGLISWVSYGLSDIHIDKDGTLREAFALIPLGFIFCSLGVIGILVKMTIGLVEYLINRWKS